MCRLLQGALDQAASGGDSSIVRLCSGHFRLAEGVKIPDGVTLVGESAGGPDMRSGTWILCDNEANATISIGSCCKISHLSFFDPQQVGVCTETLEPRKVFKRA